LDNVWNFDWTWFTHLVQAAAKSKDSKTRLSSERGRLARVNPPNSRTSRPRSFAVEAVSIGLYRAGDVAAGK
jgi:hypothetical protein